MKNTLSDRSIDTFSSGQQISVLTQQQGVIALDSGKRLTLPVKDGDVVLRLTKVPQSMVLDMLVDRTIKGLGFTSREEMQQILKNSGVQEHMFAHIEGVVEEIMRS